MPPLSRTRLKRFLTETKLARLATVKPDGAPYVNPVWFLFDGQFVYVHARARAQYVENLKRQPRVAICMDADTPPHTRVLLEGDAEVLEKVPKEIHAKLLMKYRDDMAPGYREATKGFPRVWVRVSPSKVTSWEGAMWHPRYFA